MSSSSSSSPKLLRGGDSRLHLSRLSRGVGEKTGGDAGDGGRGIQVLLEPEDLVSPPSSDILLPPIHTHPWTFPEGLQPEPPEPLVPTKTFSTRKGILLLYSDVDEKMRNNDNNNNNQDHRNKNEDRGKRNTGKKKRKRGRSEFENEENLKTINDLTTEILAYGNSGGSFVRNLGSPRNPGHFGSEVTRPGHFGSEVSRPGHSPTRYLRQLRSKMAEDEKRERRNDREIDSTQIEIKFPKIFGKNSSYSKGDTAKTPLPYRFYSPPEVTILPPLGTATAGSSEFGSKSPDHRPDEASSPQDPDLIDVSDAIYLAAPTNSRDSSFVDYKQMNIEDKREIVAGVLLGEILETSIGRVTEENESPTPSFDEDSAVLLSRSTPPSQRDANKGDAVIGDAITGVASEGPSDESRHLGATGLNSHSNFTDDLGSNLRIFFTDERRSGDPGEKSGLTDSGQQRRRFQQRQQQKQLQPQQPQQLQPRSQQQEIQGRKKTKETREEEEEFGWRKPRQQRLHQRLQLQRRQRQQQQQSKRWEESKTIHEFLGEYLRATALEESGQGGEGVSLSPSRFSIANLLRDRDEIERDGDKADGDRVVPLRQSLSVFGDKNKSDSTPVVSLEDKEKTRDLKEIEREKEFRRFLREKGFVALTTRSGFSSADLPRRNRSGRPRILLHIPAREKVASIPSLRSPLFPFGRPTRSSSPTSPLSSPLPASLAAFLQTPEGRRVWIGGREKPLHRRLRREPVRVSKPGEKVPTRLWKTAPVDEDEDEDKMEVDFAALVEEAVEEMEEEVDRVVEDVINEEREGGDFQDDLEASRSLWDSRFGLSRRIDRRWSLDGFELAEASKDIEDGDDKMTPRAGSAMASLGNEIPDVSLVDKEAERRRLSEERRRKEEEDEEKRREQEKRRKEEERMMREKQEKERMKIEKERIDRERREKKREEEERRKKEEEQQRKEEERKKKEGEEDKKTLREEEERRKQEEIDRKREEEEERKRRLAEEKRDRKEEEKRRKEEEAEKRRKEKEEERERRRREKEEAEEEKKRKEEERKKEMREKKAEEKKKKEEEKAAKKALAKERRLEKKREAEEERERKRRLKEEEERRKREEEERRKEAEVEEDAMRRREEEERNKEEEEERRRKEEEEQRKREEEEEEYQKRLSALEREKALRDVEAEELAARQREEEEEQKRLAIEERARIAEEERRREEQERLRRAREEELEERVRQTLEEEEAKRRLEAAIKMDDARRMKWQQYQLEARGLDWRKEISRSWVYSYFQLLRETHATLPPGSSPKGEQEGKRTRIGR